MRFWGCLHILNIHRHSALIRSNLFKPVTVQGLLMLINDLLDIAKIEASGIEIENIPFRLDEVLNDALSMTIVPAHEKGLEVKTHLDAIAGQTFRGDPTRIRQIIVNLCSNAVKFTSKGTITLEVDCEEASEKGIRLVSIRVTDTGTGISPENVEKIFNKFTQADNTITRKFGGTGWAGNQQNIG